MNEAATTASDLLSRWRILMWGAIAVLIAAPAIAMQFTSEIHWTIADFVFAAILLGGAGLAAEFANRASGSSAYRGGVVVALGTGVLLLWANGAVGIVGHEGLPINLWFNLVPLLALFAAIGACFRARGMVVAMTATAVAQVAVGAIVQYCGHFTWVFTSVWTGGWLLSAYLFRGAVGEQQRSNLAAQAGKLPDTTKSTA